MDISNNSQLLPRTEVLLFDMLPCEIKYRVRTDGDSYVIRKSTRYGTDIKETDLRIENPLHFIIENIVDPDERYESCRLLCDCKIDVNMYDCLGQTALQYLLNKRIGGECKDNGKLLDLLISKGANINRFQNDKIQDSPLYLAVDADNLKAVKKLLQLGANVNEENCSDCRLLVKAIKNESEIMFKLLLRYNAQVTDYYVLREATSSKDSHFLRMIFECCNELNVDTYDSCFSNWFSDGSEWILHHPIIDGNLDTVEFLLHNARNIEIDDELLASHFPSGIFTLLYQRFTIRHQTREYVRCHEIFKIVIKHIAIIMETDDGQVEEDILNCIDRDNSILEELERCRKQLRAMKSCLVQPDSRLTYFDLLTKRGESLSNCCSEEIFLEMSERKLKENFPDFAKHLMVNVQKALTRKIFWKDFKTYLHITIGEKLHFELIHCICDFLKIEDLAAFRFHDVDALIEKM